jgi:cytochrome c-type biogenesis protein CcmE
MKPKTIIGLALITVFTFFVVRSFSQQVGGYENFLIAEERGNRAHVVGEWERTRPATYDRFANTFSFYMRDGEGQVRQVIYGNPQPANFEDAEKVVVEGRMQDGVFMAQHILVKCPSKYNDERDFMHPDVAPGTERPMTHPASL